MKRLFAALTLALLCSVALAVSVASATHSHGDGPQQAEGSSAKSSQDEVSTQERRLRNFTKTRTTAQSGFAGFTQPGINPPISAPSSPYTFSKTRKVVRLNSVTITATMDDADTAPGDQDANNLFLALDDIDTGIALNGFRSGVADTLTISGRPNNSGAILNALKSDNRLAASIIDTDPGDNGLSIPATAQTTLQIKGKIRR
jgi:hypothetical protein